MTETRVRPETVTPDMLDDLFWSHVDKNGPNGCWEWTGALNQSGYAQIRRWGFTWQVHRLTYEAHYGERPQQQVDHLCKNTRCCNPEHLEDVTPAENNRRSDSPSAKFARATHCIRGHEFPTESEPGKARICKPCRDAHYRRVWPKRYVPVEATGLVGGHGAHLVDGVWACKCGLTYGPGSRKFGYDSQRQHRADLLATGIPAKSNKRRWTKREVHECGTRWYFYPDLGEAGLWTCSGCGSVRGLVDGEDR
jgi:HNH endonuclease